MKQYISLEIQLIFLENTDIVTASVGDNDITSDDIFD